MHKLMSFVLSPLCFHGLTNCFSRKAFVFKKICVATRVYPLCCRIQPSVAPAIVSFSVFSSLQTLFLSLLSCSTPVPLFSVGYTLFRKNTGVWGQRGRGRRGGRAVSGRGRMRNRGPSGGGTLRSELPQQGQRPSSQKARVASARSQ